MSRDTIGIVGCDGNLGSQMVVQVQESFIASVGFDSAPTGHRALAGIDPQLQSVDTLPIDRAASIDTLLDECAVIHWCAPSTSANIQKLGKNTLLIFHDSVMDSSLQNALRLSQNPNVKGKIAIAHCLMNPEKRVVIASDFGQSQHATRHIQKLGLEPVGMSVQEHDHVMARSQAVLAVLVKTLLPDLVQYEQQGLLTSSAHELLKSLRHRESRWTQATIDTMLNNPQLVTLFQELSGWLHPKVETGIL